MYGVFQRGLHPAVERLRRAVKLFAGYVAQLRGVGKDLVREHGLDVFSVYKYGYFH